MTNEEIEAGIVEILKSHGLPVSIAATSQAREHAKRVAGFYRSVARKLDALTTGATTPTGRAEGFWWARRSDWETVEVVDGSVYYLGQEGSSDLDYATEHEIREWGEYLGKGPR